jgi:hypothetical protein
MVYWAPILHFYQPPTQFPEALKRSPTQIAAGDEFHAGCRTRYLQGLKTLATDLLTEVERLDRRL